MNTPITKCLYAKTDEYTIVKFTQDSMTTFSTESEVVGDSIISIYDEQNKNVKWNVEQYGFSATLYDTEGFEWHVFTDAQMLI